MRKKEKPELGKNAFRCQLHQGRGGHLQAHMNNNKEEYSAAQYLLGQRLGRSGQIASSQMVAEQNLLPGVLGRLLADEVVATRQKKQCCNVSKEYK